MANVLENVLVPESYLAGKDSEIRALVDPLKEWDGLDADGPECGACIRRYLLFSHPELLPKVGISDLDRGRIFLNRYHWFLCYSNHYIARHGRSGNSLEEYSYQLLKRSPIPTTPELWDAYEAIEKAGPFLPHIPR